MCTSSHSCETQYIKSLFRNFNGIINTDHNLSFRQKFLDKVQSNFINIISTDGLISQLNWIDTLGSSTIEYYPSLSSYLNVTSALTKYFNYTPITIDSQRPYTPITIDSQRPSEYEILQFYVELFVSIKPKRIPQAYPITSWEYGILEFTLKFTSLPGPTTLGEIFPFPLSLILSIVFLNLYHLWNFVVTKPYVSPTPIQLLDLTMGHTCNRDDVWRCRKKSICQ